MKEEKKEEEESVCKVQRNRVTTEGRCLFRLCLNKE